MVTVVSWSSSGTEPGLVHYGSVDVAGEDKRVLNKAMKVEKLESGKPTYSADSDVISGLLFGPCSNPIL